LEEAVGFLARQGGGDQSLRRTDREDIAQQLRIERCPQLDQGVEGDVERPVENRVGRIPRAHMFTHDVLHQRHEISHLSGPGVPRSPRLQTRVA